MSGKNLKSLLADIVPYAIGSAIGAAFIPLLGPTASEAFRDAQSEVNGYRARAAGGIVFETENETEKEKKCLVETEKFVQTLPENFIKPIKDYGVFVRVAEIDYNEAPNFSRRNRRVTLYYNRQTKLCDIPFSAAHELGHVFDVANNALSEGKDYRAVVDEALESPELKKIISNPAAQAEMYAQTKGSPDKFIREETFADMMACQLLPNAHESNFLGFCHRPGAAKARAYVASTLKP